jgi:predicted RND superfamily exporter protein
MILFAARMDARLLREMILIGAWFIGHARAECVGQVCHSINEDLFETNNMLLQTDLHTSVSEHAHVASPLVVTSTHRAQQNQVTELANGSGINSSEYERYAELISPDKSTKPIGPEPIAIMALILAPMCIIIGAVTYLAVFSATGQIEFKNIDAVKDHESAETLGQIAVAVMQIPRSVIALTVFASVAGAIGASFIMQVTSLSFEPMPGQYSYVANKHFNEIFPNVINASQTVGLLDVVPPAKVIDACDDLEKFSFALRSRLNESGHLLSYTSNATVFVEDGVDIGPVLSGSNGSKLLFTWALRTGVSSHEAVEFARFSTDVFQKLVDESCPGVAFNGLMGQAIMIQTGVDTGELEFLATDLTSIAIALCVLAYFIRNDRLLLIPLVNMSMAMSLSFGIMYCVGTVREIASSAPVMMTSVLIAMSLDYSLFLLTRLKEEIDMTARLVGQTSSADNGETGSSLSALSGSSNSGNVTKIVRLAASRTIETAGFMILTSGSILALSFAMLIFFRLDMIATMGMGCCVCILMAIWVHLTMTPAMLITFPEFFVNKLLPDASTLAAEAAIAEPTDTRAERFWRWLAARATSYPRNIFLLLAIVLFTGLVGYNVKHMETSRHLLQFMPRGSNIQQTFDRMTAAYSPGISFPYYVMLEPTTNESVISHDFWYRTQQFFDSLVNNDLNMNLSYSELSFISYLGGLPVPWEGAMGCRTSMGRGVSIYGELRTGVSICPSVEYMFKQFINEDETATYGMIQSAIEPTTAEGDANLVKLRILADEFMSKRGSNMRITIASTAADAHDVRAAVYEALPYMVVVTLSLCLILLGVIFRSVIVPIRSVGTICLTLLFVYGMGTLTYQHGIFDWTRHPGLSSRLGGTCWLSPVLSFTVVVGLCLDYDIFFLSRATEFRRKGEDPDTSVCMASYKTGSIISAAGVIMIAAFGGQLFASIPMASQFAFNMIFAVFYDTFVIQCLFTPASMSLLGRWNWWPSRLSENMKPSEIPRSPRQERVLSLIRDTSPSLETALGSGQLLARSRGGSGESLEKSPQVQKPRAASRERR